MAGMKTAGTGGARILAIAACLMPALAAFSLVALAAAPARAEKMANPIAIFAGLDKITARITAFEVPIGETVAFGALKVTPRVCYSRPPTEPPRTTAFVEIDEIKLDKSEGRIFTGWMFASSPGLHAVEHPVFDIWLTACKSNVAEPQQEAGKPEGAAPQQAQ